MAHEISEVEISSNTGDPSDIRNITGSIPLPPNASTFPEQQTQTTKLTSIDGKLNSLGQKTKANSVPVTIASDQTMVSLTASAPTAVSVGTTSTSVIGTNANRKGLVLINTSNKIISIGIGAAAVLNSGITLTQFGTFVMDEMTYSTQAINAIASGAASNLAVQEFT